METFSLSFTALLLKGEMHRELGGFDEGLDGGEWCLRDYIRRAETRGYHSCVTAQPELSCSRETVFGSTERRQEQARLSQETYLSRWGAAHNYCLYFGKDTQSGDLSNTIETIVAGARQGHRFTLLLHRKQFKEFRKRGWNASHTNIAIHPLPMFGAARSLARRLAELQSADPDLIVMCGTESVLFPDNHVALSFNENDDSGTNAIPSHLDHPLEVV
jgi:hypothetical protein